MGPKVDCMTLKSRIVDELLDSVDDAAGREGLFERYKASKGPFYLGLAEATSRLCDHLEEVRQQTRDSEVTKESLCQQVKALGEQHQLLADRVQALDQQVLAAETQHDEVR